MTAIKVNENFANINDNIRIAQITFNDLSLILKYQIM